MNKVTVIKISHNQGNISFGEERIGLLVHPITKGKSVRVLNETGSSMFVTSEVTSIKGRTFRTKNSRYFIKHH